MYTNEENSKRKANRFYLSYKDCNSATTYLELLIEQFQKFNSPNEFTINRALLTSAIIAYSRPFTINYGNDEVEEVNKNSKPDEEQVLEKNEKLINLHNKILEKRNTVIAHSDGPSLNPILTEVRGKGTTRGLAPIKFKDIDLNDFLILSKKMRIYFQSKALELDLSTK